ncbi:MAG: hypothetical protein WBM40_01110 [Thiohalocapsa sp.]
MTTSIEPVSMLNQRATNLLIQQIGIVETIRSLNQFRTGSGDYTKERQSSYKDMSVDDIAAALSELRARTDVAVKAN